MKTDHIYTGDCLEVMKEFPDNSIDSIVTDPPYGLEFMGKEWDNEVPPTVIWEQCLRILKPGGHLLSFAGTRTYHKMATNVENAGFQIRDMISWVYGSGFPKSLNIGKAVDKLQGNEREVVGEYKRPDGSKPRKNVKAKAIWNNADGNDQMATKGNSPWEGWGTALKPAHEPIVVARKPLIGTVAENVLEHGTGGMNIDGCRVENTGKSTRKPLGKSAYQKGGGIVNGGKAGTHEVESEFGGGHEVSRFPANFIHDGSDEVLERFPDVGGGKFTSVKRKRNKGWANSSPGDGVEAIDNYGDSGSAARFFYTAKASKSERNMNLEGYEPVRVSDGRKTEHHVPNLRTTPKKNFHPTVKPVDLMQYLCRLVTPPKGICLDPFLGSGTTAIACMRENFKYIGIEINPEYVNIAKGRISKVQPKLL